MVNGHSLGGGTYQLTSPIVTKCRIVSWGGMIFSPSCMPLSLHMAPGGSPLLIVSNPSYLVLGSMAAALEEHLWEQQLGEDDSR